MVKWARLLKHPHGVSLLSYGLIVGLISVVALVAVTSVGRSSNTLFEDVSDSLRNALSNSSNSTAAASTPTPEAVLSLTSAGDASNMNVTSASAYPATIGFVVENTGNLGSDDLSSVVSLSGANPTAFEITANNCSGSVAAGDTCQVDIRPRVDAPASFSAVLTIAAHGAPSLALSGTNALTEASSALVQTTLRTTNLISPFAIWSISPGHNLPNATFITELGFDSDRVSSGTISILRRDSSSQYAVLATTSFNHTGTPGIEYFDLAEPYLIPSSGDHYVAVYVTSPSGTNIWNRTSDVTNRAMNTTTAGVPNAPAVMTTNLLEDSNNWVWPTAYTRLQ